MYCNLFAWSRLIISSTFTHIRMHTHSHSSQKYLGTIMLDIVFTQTSRYGANICIGSGDHGWFKIKGAFS